MNPRQAFFACLQRTPPAVFEAAVWMAVEHDPQVLPESVLRDFRDLQQRVSAGLPDATTAIFLRLVGLRPIGPSISPSRGFGMPQTTAQ